MQLESLKIFCDVARHRSFSEAARANDVTQSAVSQIVSALEKDIHVQLIDRSTRPLQLTGLGKTYYEGVKNLIEQYDELAASIRNTRGEVVGLVRVAAIYSVGLGDMGHLVQQFQASFPKAQVHIDYVHPDRVYERVLDGTADLGLVSYPKKAPHLAAVRWREEEMVLACSPRNPLARRLALPIEELKGAPYVHFDRNLGVRRRIDRFLREHGVTIDVVAEFDNIENIKQAVGIGAGVALLPEPTLRREIKARTLVGLPLFGCSLTRPLAIIYHRAQRMSTAAKRFMDLLLAPESPGAGAESPHRKEEGKSGAVPNHARGKSHKNGTPVRPTKG